MKANRLRYYFCFRSPYSYIGTKLLQEKMKDKILTNSIDFIPMWSPGENGLNRLIDLGGKFLYSEMTKSKYRYILQDVKRLFLKYKIKMKWPIDKDPCWDIPHLSYISAVNKGKGLKFINAVFKARWERGIDICRKENISEISEKQGLDGKKIIEACDDEKTISQGSQFLYQCYKDGVFGIPFYINGNSKFWGIDRFNEFLESIN